MSNKKLFAIEMLKKRCQNVSEVAESIYLIYENHGTIKDMEFETAELISCLNSLFDSLYDGFNIDVDMIYKKYFGDDEENNDLN